MTLQALGRQYAAEADTLEGLVAACQVRRKAAMRAGIIGEAKRQKCLADSYTQQQKDMREIAALLLRYYDAPGVDRVTQQIREETVHI